uniref:SUN domain-containing protein n=1 Tax=Strongyloides venezuelensis TaxID=75913 RepID=A0A0K0FYS0_STRVS
MSIRQSLKSKSISKEVSKQSNNEESNSLNTNENNETLTSIINSHKTDIYNDPVFKNEKGIPFTREDRKRYLNEMNKKNVVTVAYLGKCLIFYLTLYSVYALLGISVMYFFMLRNWSSDKPNLSGKGSFIGIPAINMAPILERKRENPTIKYSISDKKSYIKYLKSIDNFFTNLHETKKDYTKEDKSEDRLKEYRQPKDVFEERLKELNEDSSITRKRNIYDRNGGEYKENIKVSEIETKVIERERKSLSKKIKREKTNETNDMTNNVITTNDMENEDVEGETTTEINSTPLIVTINSFKENEDSLNVATSTMTSKNITTTQKITDNITIAPKIDNISMKNEAVGKNNETSNSTELDGKTEDIYMTENEISCSGENNYGYSKGEPCFIIYLNNVYNWRRPIFSNSNIPKKYQGDLQNLLNDTALPHIIPVTCQLKSKEQNGSDYFLYSFKGIIDQTNYYPFNNKKKTLNRPQMMVQLKNIPKNENVQISCRYYMDVEVSSAEEDAMTLKFNVNISQ